MALLETVMPSDCSGILAMQCSSPSSLRKVQKVKVRVKFTLEQAAKAQRWSRGIALLSP
jgi:hypothetical protein